MTQPILSGFYPDPTICRVGHDYFLANSSFEYFPGVPIFHSRDLIHWQQIGHCLTRESQLPLHQAAASAGIYAPTLRHHNGTFYLITTNVSRGLGHHFIVKADDPAGPWSEPVPVRGGCIDPSLFFDDDGTVYFTCNGLHGTNQTLAIMQSRLNLDTGNLLNPLHMIWSGTGGRDPEGPHLYKINGRYYLLIAEGGTSYGHMVTIARSESPDGPYEPCPHNPILTHRSKKHPVQAVGHADLFQDTAGQWWIVCLGVRPEDYPARHHLGRETFLTPVEWTADGWPIVGDAGMLPLELDAQRLPAPCPLPPESLIDHFDESELPLHWNFLRTTLADHYQLDARPGWLRLHGNRTGLNDVDTTTFIGRRQRFFDCTFSALFDYAPAGTHEEAGIVIRMNEQFHYELFITRRDGQRVAGMRRTLGSLSKAEGWVPLPDGEITLICQADRLRYRFAIQTDPHQPPISVGAGETSMLCTEVAGGFTGVYFGLYATGNGQDACAPADIDWVQITP